MQGCWCIRRGGALPSVEAPSGAAAMPRLRELHPLGAWTDDSRELVACPQDACPEIARPQDYTRAVLNASPVPRRSRVSQHNFRRVRVTSPEPFGWPDG